MEIMEYFGVINGENNVKYGLKPCKRDLSLRLRTKRSGVRIPSGVPKTAMIISSQFLF